MSDEKYAEYSVENLRNFAKIYDRVVAHTENVNEDEIASLAEVEGNQLKYDGGQYDFYAIASSKAVVISTDFSSFDYGYDVNAISYIEYNGKTIIDPCFVVLSRRAMFFLFERGFFEDLWDCRVNYGDDLSLWTKITECFENEGFSIFVLSEKFFGKNFCPSFSLNLPYTLIDECGSPIVNIDCFYRDFSDALQYSAGNQCERLMCKISENKKLVNSLYLMLILNENHAKLKKTFNLNFPLSADSNYTVKNKIALMLHIYDISCLDVLLKYAVNMPNQCDCFVTTGSEEKASIVKKAFERENCFGKITVIIAENRGRDISALLVGFAPYIADYEYICFAHDKKVTQLNEAVQGWQYASHCYENIFCSKGYVANVIELFEKNPHLGMLTPPPPFSGHYFATAGSYDWGCNYENTRKLMQQFGWKLPISIDIEPIAPFGTMFWFRSAALEPLLKKKWKYDDFMPEPNGVDGTLLHAIERLYPFSVQQAGYYSGWIMNASYAVSYMAAQSYMLREIQTSLTQYIMPSSFSIERKMLKKRRFYIELLIRSIIPTRAKSIYKWLRNKLR